MPSAKSLPSASRPKVFPRLLALVRKHARACEEAGLGSAVVAVPWEEVPENALREVEEALANGLLCRQGRGAQARLVPTNRLAMMLCELPVTGREPGESAPGAARARKPTWKDKELWLGKVRVKRLVRHAPSQECVLEAFEKAGWPRRIACPLKDGKKRRRETVESLNERQEGPLIRFRVSDGGITWELVERSGRA
jgi:hypothetical protein